MDNPTQSLFHGNDIKINTSQNNEEEEDIEDQKRRKEELQNLLTVALDDFNYDESTVNSSTNISAASFEDVQNTYQPSSSPNEQLKVLYDVRIRELNNLRQEFVDYKAKAENNIDSLKHKALLSEAEIRQLKISLKNTEDLLVEKTSKMNEWKDLLSDNERQLKSYEKIIEKYKMEICSYETTVNELQLKLADPGPFSKEAKRFNSEEIQRAHQEQVARLENVLDEQTKKAKLLEKENISLKQDLDNLILQKTRNENDNNVTIKALTKTLEDAQNQCENLLQIVEMLTSENHHLQDRLNETNSNEIQRMSQKEGLDYSTLVAHTEKLKKMLLDKAVEIDSFKAKLKNYNNDIKELLEYRQLKCNIYKKEFQQCENKDHTKSLIVMQNDIQNYRRIIEDKNQQILTLNSTNRDLQEKIEEMLLQTRNEIQNLSHKYSLPQLEQMTEELKNSEQRAKELQEKLEQSEERRLSLIKKLQESEKSNKKIVDQNVDNKNIEQERCKLENQIKALQNDLEASLNELRKLKDYSDSLVMENNKLKFDLQQCQAQLECINTVSSKAHDTNTIKKDYEDLKHQLNQVMAHLQKNKTHTDDPEIISNLESDMGEFLNSLNKSDMKNLFEDRFKHWKKQLEIIKTTISSEADGSTQLHLTETLQQLQESRNKIKGLEEALEDMTNTKTIAEGEKCSYQFQIRDIANQLENACKTIKYLETVLEDLKVKLREKDEIVARLQQNDMKSELVRLKEELSHKDNLLKICEESKSELNDLLQQAKLELEDAQKEVLALQRKLTEMNDKIVHRNLETELKEAESRLEQSRIEDEVGCENDHFKKSLQAEILKAEIKLREDLQLEYLKKMRDIERKYKKACRATNDLYEQQVQKMKNQETRYREHLAKILAECAQKIHEFENEKYDLLAQINNIEGEFFDFKKRAYANEENYKQMMTQAEVNAEKKIGEWKMWSKQFVSNCLKIEIINKKSRDNILSGMKNMDSEIALIEKTYKDKVKKYLKSDRI